MPCNSGRSPAAAGRLRRGQAALANLLTLDALNHCARFEKYLSGDASREEFSGLIRNELPHETYLELAVWYHGLDLDETAAKVLDLAPPTAEGFYWLAYLRHDVHLLVQAEALRPEFHSRSGRNRFPYWNGHAARVGPGSPGTTWR